MATTQLVGDYDTQAKLTLKGLDRIAKPLAIFAASPGKIKAQSRYRRRDHGERAVEDAERAGGNGGAESARWRRCRAVALKARWTAAGDLQNGVATLEPLHITGQDTDLRASGSAQVLGVTDPKGGQAGRERSGSINTAIAHTFQPGR